MRRFLRLKTAKGKWSKPQTRTPWRGPMVHPKVWSTRWRTTQSRQRLWNSHLSASVSPTRLRLWDTHESRSSVAESETTTTNQNGNGNTEIAFLCSWTAPREPTKIMEHKLMTIKVCSASATWEVKKHPNIPTQYTQRQRMRRMVSPLNVLSISRSESKT